MVQCFTDHSKSVTKTILRPFKTLENNTNINKTWLFYEHAFFECSQHWNVLIRGISLVNIIHWNSFPRQNGQNDCDTTPVVKLIKCECKNPCFSSRKIRCDLSLV